MLDDLREKPAPVFTVSCSRCNGYHQKIACALCDGSGLEPRYSCVAHEARGLEVFMRCYSNLVTHGSWPNEGGVGDQAGKFVSAVMIADSERGVCESDAVKKATGKSAPAPPIIIDQNGKPMRQQRRGEQVEPSQTNPAENFEAGFGSRH